MPKNLNDPTARKTLSKSRPQYIYEMAGFYKSLEKKALTDGDRPDGNNGDGFVKSPNSLLRFILRFFMVR